MFVKYFIPEDGDEQAHPNVFRLEASQPTLAEIKSAFPVPGLYHFRFLKNIGSHIVWLDAVDDGSALPMFQGSLFIKVSRIANSSSSVPSVGHGVTSPAPNAFSQPEPSPRVNEAASAPPPVKAPKPSVEKQKSEKLLKFDDDITGSPSSNSSDFTASAPAASSGASLLPESDLLGISSSAAPDTAAPKPSTSSSDFFGMDTLQPVSAPVSGMMGATQRSLSPMNPMTANMPGGGIGGPMGAMNGAGRGPMGAMGAPQGVMGGGRGPQGGMQQQGRGVPPPQRQMGGPGTPGYDPFNNIAGLNGLSGAGASGRR